MVPAPRELRLDPTTLALRTGSLFGLLMAPIFGLLGAALGFVIGLPLGPCALLTAVIGFVAGALAMGSMGGALFGGMMAAIQMSMTPEGRPPEDLEDGEHLVVWGVGTHQRGLEAVGGTLAITSRRVRFAPHAMNLQTEPWEWPLPHIMGTEVRKSLGLFENRLVLKGVDGTEQSFVVEGPQAWREALDEAMGAAV